MHDATLALIELSEIEAMLKARSQLVPSGDKWVLFQPIRLTILYSGFVEATTSLDVEPGFTFEHSVPRPLRAFLSPVYGCRTAAFVHDALYRSALISKDVADQLYTWLTTAPTVAASRYATIAAKFVRAFGQTERATMIVTGVSGLPRPPEPMTESAITHICIHVHTEVI